MEIDIKRYITGPIETNTYLVLKNSSCMVVDPSSDCDDVCEFIDDNRLTVNAVLLTHGHFDHILGVEEILKRYSGINVWIHGNEKIFLEKAEYNGSMMIGIQYSYKGPIKELHEGIMNIGQFEFSVLHVPGHSPGGCAFIFGKSCLCGDSLFAGSIGRTDLPGGNGELLLKNIREKLFFLPDETVVYPGHGGRTTIGREKRLNPFFT